MKLSPKCHVTTIHQDAKHTFVLRRNSPTKSRLAKRAFMWAWRTSASQEFRAPTSDRDRQRRQFRQSAKQRFGLKMSAVLEATRPAGTQKTFGKSTREVPHHSNKAKKWYPAEDEVQKRKVCRPNILERGAAHCRRIGIVIRRRKEQEWLLLELAMMTRELIRMKN